MGMRFDEMFPDDATHDDGGEQAHIARAAAALGDPDLPRLLAALDSSLGDLEQGLEATAGAMLGAARDIGRSRAAIRVLGRPAGLQGGAGS